MKTVDKKFLARFNAFTWSFIFGGMLIGTLGIAARHDSPVAGWALIAAGALLTAAGFTMIYIRSTLEEEVSQASSDALK